MRFWLMSFATTTATAARKKHTNLAVCFMYLFNSLLMGFDLLNVIIIYIYLVMRILYLCIFCVISVLSLSSCVYVLRNVCVCEFFFWLYIHLFLQINVYFVQARVCFLILPFTGRDLWFMVYKCLKIPQNAKFLPKYTYKIHICYDCHHSICICECVSVRVSLDTNAQIPMYNVHLQRIFLF